MTITLHYLNKSRATRIVWLLEELNVPFEVKTYFRNPKTMLAPPELKRIHPTGNSPLLEDDGIVYAESGNIVDHLLTKYGQKSSLIWKNDQELATIKYAMYAAESNLAITGMSIGIHQKAVEKVPWGFQTIVRLLLTHIDSFYAQPTFDKTMNFLQDQITNNGGWYCNGRLTAADIMFEVTLEQFIGLGMPLNLEKNYPGLWNWRQRILKEPGYMKAQELQKKWESQPHA